MNLTATGGSEYAGDRKSMLFDAMHGHGATASDTSNATVETLRGATVISLMGIRIKSFSASLRALHQSVAQKNSHQKAVPDATRPFE